MDCGYFAELRVFLDVIIASFFAGIVGIERESEDKPAGIRTNIIVGGSSCLIVSLISPLVVFMDQFSTDIITVDPMRVLNAWILGVSFVGVGTILKISDKMQVRGLTTAATLLYSSGIGVSVAIKLYILAGCITLLTIMINHFLPKLLDKIRKGPIGYFFDFAWQRIQIIVRALHLFMSC